MKYKVVGSAGTGKTTYITNYILSQLSANTQPNNICSITFTRSASRELISRVIKKTGLQRSEFTHFGTLHSICYHLLNLTRQNVVSSEDIQEFCKINDLEYSVKELDEDAYIMSDMIDEQSPTGNILFSVFEWAVVNYPTNPTEHLRDAPSYEYLPLHIMNEEDVRYYFNQWVKYKKQNQIYDFTDFLIEVLRNNYIPDVEYLIVDEFQDFSKLQYSVYKMWAYNCNEVMIAGDEAQCIYSYAGANPIYFIKEDADRVIILDKSYRLPSSILNYSMCLHGMMHSRINRQIHPADTSHEGEVIYIEYPDEEFLVEELNKLTDTKTAFILLRTNYMVQMVAEVLMKRGILFNIIRGQTPCTVKLKNTINALIKLQNNQSLLPVEYKALIEFLPAKGLLRHGAKTRINRLDNPLTKGEFMSFFERKKNPIELVKYLNISPNRQMLVERRLIDNKMCPETNNISIGTIHASKGLEADVVFLFNDITRRIAKQHEKDPDAELRVFYVGATRARQKLYILNKFFGKYGLEEINPQHTQSKLTAWITDDADNTDDDYYVNENRTVKTTETSIICQGCLLPTTEYFEIPEFITLRYLCPRCYSELKDELNESIRERRKFMFSL